MIIEKFFQQTNETIWGFLTDMGQRKDVFSVFSYVYPGMENYVTYFYAVEKEIVILLLDNNPKGTVEWADRGIYSKPFKYFKKVCIDGKVSQDKKDWRDSPAEDLFHAAKMMRDFISSKTNGFELVPAIHCMLLTNVTIINYHDVVKSWQQPLFGFSALHNLDYEELCNNPNHNPVLPVNNDYCIKGGDYWKGWVKYISDKGWLDWLKE